MNFASELRRELVQWVCDGLVEPTQAEAIRERYPDQDAGGTTSLLLPAIYIIGAALIGGGAISFVAANWDSIPIPVRIGLLVNIRPQQFLYPVENTGIPGQTHPFRTELMRFSHLL